jgi:hypothetical protein
MRYAFTQLLPNGKSGNIQKVNPRPAPSQITTENDTFFSDIGDLYAQ